MLTPGNVADVTAAPELLARMGRARYVLADKGYDADPLRRALRQAGAVPVIPGRSCGSACKRDPLSGVIGVQKGPLISMV